MPSAELNHGGLVKKQIFTALIAVMLFANLSYAMVICDDEKELASKADLVVVGEITKLEPTTAFTVTEKGFKEEPESKSGKKLMLATIKVEKVVKGDNSNSEITVEFYTLDKTLEADVQDEQLDTIGEKGKAYLYRLPNGHYKIISGICGWFYLGGK